MKEFPTPNFGKRSLMRGLRQIRLIFVSCVKPALWKSGFCLLTHNNVMTNKQNRIVQYIDLQPFEICPAAIFAVLFRPAGARRCLAGLAAERQAMTAVELSNVRKSGSSYLFMDSRDFTTRFARGTSEGFRGQGKWLSVRC
jgi:hypothetical protein